MIEGTRIVAEARTWLDTPYRHGARLKGIGCDCIGLIVGVALMLGVPEADAFSTDVRFKGYSPTPDPVKLLQACDIYLNPLANTRALELGDILVLRFLREPHHFAFVTQVDPLYIIHAYAAVDKVAEHRVDDIWRRRIMLAYRFR